MNEPAEPTLADIKQMRESLDAPIGDRILSEKMLHFLPWLLNLAEAEIASRPQREATLARWEAFKEKIRREGGKA